MLFKKGDVIFIDSLLGLFNILGREVAELIYEVELNGQQLPSGIYFYTIKTVKFSQTREMILLK